MQLGQVDRLNPEALGRLSEAVLHLQLGVAGWVEVLAAAHLGNDDAIGRPFGDVSADALFAQAGAVDVGGVPKGDASIICGREDFFGAIVLDRTEVATELPATNTDFGDGQP